MAITLGIRHEPVPDLSPQLRQAYDDYQHFVLHILTPAKEDLESKVRENAATLHQVFGANLIAAHSVDYLLAVREAAGILGGRKELVISFDRKFAVAGTYLRSRKMELIDAINNGLKHIRIDPLRYKSVREQYGQISFQSLDECGGRVMCHLDGYRFDYCRVVLLPALTALSSWMFCTPVDVLDFAKGDFATSAGVDLENVDELYDPMDPSTAIDRMVELCNPVCLNCEEAADDCHCAEYVFAGEKGQYEPRYSASSDRLQALMNHISPSFHNA
ncbi:MAG: hypothetical protein K2X55_07595 [Burkholderiaceae bacterium]|nr:hypothetical protein [Burkholderiaceae bacterium]